MKCVKLRLFTYSTSQTPQLDFATGRKEGKRTVGERIGEDRTYAGLVDFWLCRIWSQFIRRAKIASRQTSMPNLFAFIQFPPGRSNSRRYIVFESNQIKFISSTRYNQQNSRTVVKKMSRDSCHTKPNKQRVLAGLKESVISLHSYTHMYIYTLCLKKTRQLRQAVVSTSVNQFWYFFVNSINTVLEMIRVFNFLCRVTFTYFICS